ncbi:MAG: S8 family serine peptidase, partial [Fibrobacteria bacterium]
EAWDTYTGDQNVIVGIIDTGIDYLHPDLVDNIWTNPGEIPGNGLDDDGNGYIDDVHGYDFANHDSDPMDDHFHGTHCAGTIAGSGNNGQGVAGVAWKAKLAALKFLDASGSGSLEGAVEAIAYANAMDIPITSNSWGGGGFSQALKDVIDAGGERGFLFVAAAGNESNDNDQFPAYPASYDSPNIISVAATDSRDEVAFFSNTGVTTVDLGAPGVDVYSCAPGGQYQYLSGTSMATPHVSGAAALLKSYNPQLGYAELKAALLAGVDPIPSLNGRVLSNGRLNVAKALNGVSPPWVVIAPRGPGELAFGASQALTARVDPKGLTAGEHRALVTIATNDPIQPDRELEIIARVSACRSLTVSPSALSFGGVWKGTSRKLNLTLINTCNDVTRIDAVESSHGGFTAAGTLPIAIPAFGKTSLEVVYTPDDLTADKAVLTLKSNAQDNPTLKVDLAGTGVEPPKVAADPSRFELTLDPAGQAVRKLTVRNTGGDVLNIKLSVGKLAPVQPKGAGTRIAGSAPAGLAYATTKGSAKSPNLHPFFKAQASDLKVLYLTTLLSDGEEDGLVAGLRGLANVGSVDVVSGSSSTPDLAYLQNYDLVVVSANRPWANASSLGNTLADYVDNGGGLCLMVAAIARGGGFSLQGRIVLPEYLPIAMEGPGLGGDATEFVSHPITDGVHSIFCGLPTRATATQGDGISLGHYPDGALVGAVNADKPIVAINVYPQDGYWGGDLILMMGNTLEYLAGGAGWLKLDVRKATIDPGSSAEFTLSMSADKQLAGDHEAAVEITHNDPISANPLRVPVLMHVRPVSHLALSPSKFDFGGVLVGGQASMKVLLSNSGNQATTVSGIGADKPFSAPIPVPILVPAFSKAEVELVFAPKKEAFSAGSAIFTSDASDHPSLAIVLRGQGLAAPAAVLNPEKVSLSLAYNASPRDVTSTLSNKGRGVLIYNIGSAKDVTPAAPALAPKPVLAQQVYQSGNYDRPAVPGELLVGLNEGQGSLANASALSASGIAVKRQVLIAKAPKGKPSYAPARKLFLVTIADPSRAGLLKAIDALRKDPNVAYAEPNYRLKAIGLPDDPDFGLLWGMHNGGQTGGVPDADIDAPEAWDTYTGDQNVIVGIIDTGIDYLHPDLVDNIWTNPGE